MYFGTGTTSTDCFPAATGCCKDVCYYCCCWGLTGKKKWISYVHIFRSGGRKPLCISFFFSLQSFKRSFSMYYYFNWTILQGERTYDWHFFRIRLSMKEWFLHWLVNSIITLLVLLLHWYYDGDHRRSKKKSAEDSSQHATRILALLHGGGAGGSLEG